jgi:hypothetical protein
MVQGGVNGNPALISTGFTPVRPIFDGDFLIVSLFQRKYGNKRNQARFSVSSEKFTKIFCNVVSNVNSWPNLTASSVNRFIQAYGY